MPLPNTPLSFRIPFGSTVVLWTAKTILSLRGCSLSWGGCPVGLAPIHKLRWMNGKDSQWSSEGKSGLELTVSPTPVLSVPLTHAGMQHYFRHFPAPWPLKCSSIIPSSQVPTQDTPHIPALIIIMSLTLKLDGQSGTFWSHLAQIISSKKIESLFPKKRKDSFFWSTTVFSAFFEIGW